MNPASTVLASVVIITSTTIIRRVRESKGKGQARVLETVVFGFLLLISLQILSIVMPSIAQILGYLGIVGAFALNGPALFTFLGDFGRGKGTV